MSDNWRRSRGHTTEDRDIASEHARRARHPQAHPIVEPIADSDGKPEIRGDDEVSMPSEIVLSDPAAIELWSRIDRLAARCRPLESAVARIRGLERGAGTIRKVLAAVALAAMGSLATVASGLYSRGASEGADRVRIDRAIEDIRTIRDRDIDSIRQDLRVLERRSDITAPHHNQAGAFPVSISNQRIP